MRKLFIALIILLIPSLTLAATIKTGDSVEINDNDKNPYVFSQNIKITSDLTGDAVIFGQNINVNKNIDQSLFAFAQSVDVSGNIGQSIRSAGNTVLISGTVGEDVLVGANTLTIAETSNIKGDLIAGGATVNIYGTVEGNAKIAGAKVIISGSILGDAEINAQELIIDDTAEISGALTYWSQNEGTLSPQAKIAEGPYYNQVAKNYTNTARSITYALLSMLILALVIVYGLKRFSKKLGEVDLGSFSRNFGWGLLILVTLPIGSILIFGISLHLGFAVILAYLLFLIIAYGVSAIYTGSIIQKIITKDKERHIDWITVLIGGFVYFIIGYVPIIGNTVQFLVYLASFGYIINKTYNIISSQSAETKSSK